VSTATPIAVFGLPVRNGEQHLAEAIESLLGQTRPDVAIVVVDNCSTDRTADIAQRYGDLDRRIVYERNEQLLGLVHNWRKAFDSARYRFPAAPYFAWASDHDVWHPEWLSTLAGELDAHPEAVLACPFVVRIDDAGAEYPTRERPFETAGIPDPAERVRRTGRDLTAAGEMVYGLFRSEALERSGPFPLIVLPDRLQLLQLSVEGEFRQVSRRLWYRRFRAGIVMSNSRQRRASFLGGAPLWAYLPWPLTHTLLFVRSSRRRRLGGIVLVESVRHAFERGRRRGRRRRRWRRRERRQRLRGLLGRSANVGLSPDGRVSPLPGLARDVLDTLERPGATVIQLGEDELAVADLVVGVDALAGLSRAEMDELARRLHELGIPALYCVERESPALRAALGRWYWLRDVWVPQEGPTGRKPDPNTGPVPREPGSFRHLVGRRRLLPEHEGPQG
jgi:glycosyltransferase involved in cell wall biosynthesis